MAYIDRIALGLNQFSAWALALSMLVASFALSMLVG
jgi:hypothetical protein